MEQDPQATAAPRPATVEAESAVEVGPTVGTGPAVEVEPAVAAEVFGARLPLARAYADLLVGDGVVRGLIGPREPERIWSRHLLNCAVLTELLPPAVPADQARPLQLVDVGSGAGLPGLVLALVRPDLQVVLVEPMQRRAAFLQDVVAALGLQEQVTLVCARAESPEALDQAAGADWVTARAVAPVGRVMGWCAPLLAIGGHVALIKGAGAAEELQRDARTVRALPLVDVEVVQCGGGRLDPPTTVVTARRVATPRENRALGRSAGAPPRGRRSARSARPARRPSS